MVARFAENAFLRKEPPYRLDRPDEVTISRDQQGHVQTILEGVAHQFNGDIHVGHLFVINILAVAALAARERIYAPYLTVLLYLW
jgi:hypothetical protein